MKAYVTVMLKTTVLDPQGKTIHGALKKMSYKGVGAVPAFSLLTAIFFTPLAEYTQVTGTGLVSD